MRDPVTRASTWSEGTESVSEGGIPARRGEEGGKEGHWRGHGGGINTAHAQKTESDKGES